MSSRKNLISMTPIAKILRWTNEFTTNSVFVGKTFDDRPSWAESFDVWAWYSEGYAIVKLLNSHFPGVHVKPGFSRYVFSTGGIFAKMLG